MSGNKCSYVDCTNSARNTPGLRKFFFPVKDQERCKKWILLCGNPSLVNLDDDELKNHFLCHKHFPDELLVCKKLPPGTLPVDTKAKSQLHSVIRTYSRHSNSTETEVSSEEVSLPEKNTVRKSFTPDDSTARTDMPSKKQNKIEEIDLLALQEQQESLQPTRSPSPSIEKALLSGNKCSYADCTNSARNTPGLRKFFFPVRDEERCKKWVLLCGNPSLVNLDDDELKNHFLCHKHFPDEVLVFRKLPPGTLPVDAKAKSPLHSVVRTYSRHSNSRETEVSSEGVSLPEKNTVRKSFTAGRTDMPSEIEEIDLLVLQKQQESLQPTRSPPLSIEKAVEFPSSSECKETFDKGKLKRKVPLGTLPVDSFETRPSPLISVVRTYSKSTTSKNTLSCEKTNLPKESTCCRLLKSDDSANKSDTPIKKKKQQTKILQAASPWEQEYIEKISNLPSPPKHKKVPVPSQSNFSRNVESLPDLPRIVVKMQLNHRPGTPWTQEEIDAAILLYNKSPSMYRFLKENGFILPSEDTICK